MDIQTWLAFVTASVIILLIPGPTILLVLSYALSQGKQIALATVAGVALGDFIAMSASLAGLGALMLASATLFSFVKWIGAAYLIFLGVKLLCSAKDAHFGDIEAKSSISAQKIFAHSAAVTVFNPKSILFFIAFVPQFITQQNQLLPQFAILIATFVSLAALNALCYALLADKLRARMKRPSVVKLSLIHI